MPISKKRFGNNSGYNNTLHRAGERFKDDDTGDEDEVEILAQKLLT